MKIIIFFMIFIIAFSVKSNCGLTGCLNYSRNPIDDYFLASIDLRRQVDRESYGVFDEFKALNMTSGICLRNNKMNYAYDFSILSYLAIYKISLQPIFSTPEYPNLDSHDLNDGPTYLTFSYKGPELSNVGIYKKDYNWSSVGIDFLYKNFKRNYFYTRFSYIVTASTLQNNLDYFTDVAVTRNSKFCWQMKLKNSTNLFLTTYKIDSELKLESYYRMIFNESRQKEFGANLQYNYIPSYDFMINSEIGYIRYGINNNWKNLFKFGLGFSYVLHH